MFKINPLICWKFCRTNLVAIASNRLKAHSSNNVLKRYSTKNADTTIDQGPIKFSTSKASKHLASDSRKGELGGRLSYEGDVILVCFTTILIYFCVLREENDIDKELDRTLYSRIEGLEELQLKLCLEYNQQNGLDTVAIEERLEEIKREKENTNKAQETANIS